MFILDRIGPLRNFRPLHRPGERGKLPFAWLISPTPAAIGFAVRTTAAALLALVIALWMELDDPQWAAMTVWIVAQAPAGKVFPKPDGVWWAPP